MNKLLLIMAVICFTHVCLAESTIYRFSYKNKAGYRWSWTFTQHENSYLVNGKQLGTSELLLLKDYIKAILVVDKNFSGHQSKCGVGEFRFVKTVGSVRSLRRGCMEDIAYRSLLLSFETLSSHSIL